MCFLNSLDPSLYKLLVLAAIFFSYTKNILAVDPDCDYYQNIQFGQEYYIYNNEYPYKYKKSTSCRWTGQSPVGTVIVLSCNNVEIPFSKDCQNDKLVFSPNGDSNLDSEFYCGNTTFTAYTYGNRLSLGGQETGINEYPSMAALVDVSKFDAYCGANIISNRYAVTAAHCLNNQETSNVGLLVGDHDINSGQDTAAATLIPILSFIKHPLYDSKTQQNDIALVKTTKNIVFNMAVNAICLPFRYGEYNFQGDVVTALGWGYQDISGQKSDTLQKVDLNVISNRVCDEEMVEDIQTTQICTYGEGKDSCISDSGGPLIWLDAYTRKLELVGIISYGISCGTTKPAVNTRVTSFLSWIASATSDASFCIQ